MRSFVDTITFTFTATGPVEGFQLVGFDGLPVSQDDAAVASIALSPAKPGEEFAGLIDGWCEMPVSGAASAGDKVIAAADGKSVKAAGVNWQPSCQKTRSVARK